jgi:PAS domain S-box-containing protein
MSKIFGFSSTADYKDWDLEIIFTSKEEYLEFMECISDYCYKAEPLTMEASLQRKDGSVFDGHLSMSSSDAGSALRRSILIVSDISWRKKIEQEKIEKEKMQAVLETAGAVCHEMNQPLQCVYLSVNEILEDHNMLEDEMNKIQQHIGRIREITSKLTRITRYQTRDYINGVKIIDIDGASGTDE